MVSKKMLRSRRVCVVGAGPSGLVAARELRKEGHTVVVMEQNHDIGGQWLYEPCVEGKDPLGRAATPCVHSAVYASLRVTLPREIMCYTDFPFAVREGGDARRFPGHWEFFLYLKDYCDWFGLRELVRFNTRVDYVGMVGEYGGGSLQWVVRSTERKREKVVEETYDAVVVASGHFSQPRLPNIRGMDVWRGRQMHSHVYRVPEPFRNEVVVVVGNSLSGQDISMELVDVAEAVHLSAKSLQKISEGLYKVVNKYPNLHIRPQIDVLGEDGEVIFEDGSSVVADSIIYCTGYLYSFPFLDTRGVVMVDDNRVGPLFEHTFPPSLAPSLSFVGLTRKIITFSFYQAQAKWIAQVLSGRRTLPSCDEMMTSVKQFYRAREAAGIPKRFTHNIADFEYCGRFADYSDFPHLDEWNQLWASVLRTADDDPQGYRDWWDHQELPREAYQNTHRTQFGAEALHPYSLKLVGESV